MHYHFYCRLFFFFLSFTIYFSHELARMLSPLLPSSIRGSSDRGPRSRSNLFHFFFSALLRAYNDRVYPWKCRISIELGPRSHFSIDYTYIYIDSFFETVYCFPPNILPHLYILFSNRRLKKIERRRRIIIDHSLSCPRNWMKNWGISQRCVTLRYVTSYVTSLRYIARHRRETQATCVYPLLYLIIRHNAMTDVK